MNQIHFVPKKNKKNKKQNIGQIKGGHHQKTKD